jgi:hypothetical protein
MMQLIITFIFACLIALTFLFFARRYEISERREWLAKQRDYLIERGPVAETYEEHTSQVRAYQEQIERMDVEMKNVKFLFWL